MIQAAAAIWGSAGNVYRLTTAVTSHRRGICSLGKAVGFLELISCISVDCLEQGCGPMPFLITGNDFVIGCLILTRDHSTRIMHFIDIPACSIGQQHLPVKLHRGYSAYKRRRGVLFTKVVDGFIFSYYTYGLSKALAIKDSSAEPSSAGPVAKAVL